ncbi:MAG: 30S ribosomal protein S12 methylthiotransferase RimO [Gammaproteobacteria bacterium]|nr:30S ribosomal protein S12 methylthiotransferase RimO [Gammaproteobacteria bacterium]
MSHSIPKVGFISLGCPKALVDSEQIITRLRAEGYNISPSYDDADLVVVNTCGFIDDAVEESLDAIGEALNENGKVIVTGCLGAKGDIVANNYPQVLAVTGPHAAQEVMAAIHEHLPPEHDPYTSLVPPQGIKLTPEHYAYLKISEGCNHRCTFCIIPSLRGDLVSRPIGEVLTEAENLVNAGVRELLVISQDTSAYGVDAKYQTDFWNGRPVKTQFEQLAKELGEMDAWIRMHYVYPYPHVDKIIPLMSEGKILPYLDIPFQHASQRVLKAMKRPASSENNLQRIKAWRSICPDITIRSTFIVGFPGETDDDFDELLDFINDAELDRVGCFTYSPVEGAVANEITPQVPEDIKQERLHRFMTLQADISASKLNKKIGQTLQVMVDETDDEGIIARSMADAPEIDGMVFVNSEKTHKPGSLINVKITDSTEHDLYADEV